MRDAARLTDIRALEEVRAAFVKFRDETNQALTEVDIEVQRAVNWVRNEQAAYWKQQERKRHELLEHAKAELRRAQFPTTDGKIPSAIEQKKAVAKAEAAVEEARDKIQSVRKWSRLLEREVAEYTGLAQPLTGAIDSDIPRAIALLDRMAGSVESYLAVAPAEGDDEKTRAAEDAGGSMARPTEEASAPKRYALPLIRADRANLRARLERCAAEAPDEVRLLPASSDRTPRLSEQDADRLTELNLEQSPTDPNDRVVIEPGGLDDESPVLLRLPSRDASEPGAAWVIGSTLKEPAAGEALVVPMFRLLQGRRDLRPLMDLPPGALVVFDRRGIAALYRPDDQQIWQPS